MTRHRRQAPIGIVLAVAGFMGCLALLAVYVVTDHHDAGVALPAVVRAIPAPTPEPESAPYILDVPSLSRCAGVAQLGRTDWYDLARADWSGQAATLRRGIRTGCEDDYFRGANEGYAQGREETRQRCDPPRLWCFP